MSGGTDRVPESMRGLHRTFAWVHRHGGGPTGWRRGGKRSGRFVPYVNPARDAKSLKAGRLRKELREEVAAR